MGDPICKWRAARPHNVVELVNDILPHDEMPENDFYDIVDKRMPGFMHTPYQLACQLGLYTVVDGTYYPRFKNDIDDEEATHYLENVVTKYYVPNPYTKRGFTNLDSPILLEKSIVEYLEKYPNQNDLEQVLRYLIKEDVGNLSATKTLLSYSKLFTISGNNITLNPNYKEMEIDIDRNNKRAFFEIFNSQLNHNKIIAPFQQILFGAPGTGKSHTLNSDAHITEHNSIRTTFHPDSDYSTFVGCYKPTKKERRNVELVKLDELVKLSKERTDVAGKVKFIREYAESIKAAATDKGVSDNQIIKGDDYFGWNSDTYLKCFLDEILAERDDIGSEITYEFVPQAFTQAYVAAWKNLHEPFFLIIEEINRGNCAQIFGDIFQLLDRNEQGFSSYKITPDQDLANYIRKQLSECDCLNENFGDIKSGEKMMLPHNLYIWATMNTSDQSLFPIDSAFKRRWDWRYIPISYADNDHYISCGDISYSWADFLQKVNDKVESVTQSEDKKLGYWFMGNGKDQKEVTVDRFVSKVIFYLWNDIFKDFGKSGNTIFKDTFDKFHKFFGDDGKPKVDIVKAFLDNLGVVKVNVERDDEDKTKIDYTKYTFEGESKLTKRALGSKIIRKFLEEHKDLDYASILGKLSFDESISKDKVAGVVAKEGEIKDRDNASYSKDSFISHDGVKYKILEYWTKNNIDFIIKFAEAQGWSVTKEEK